MQWENHRRTQMLRLWVGRSLPDGAHPGASNNDSRLRQNASCLTMNPVGANVRRRATRFTEEAGGRNAEDAEGTQRAQRLPLCGPLRQPRRPPLKVRGPNGLRFRGSGLLLFELLRGHEPCRHRREEAGGAVHPLVPPRHLGAYNPDPFNGLMRMNAQRSTSNLQPSRSLKVESWRLSVRFMEKPGARVHRLAGSREGIERKTRKRESSQRSSAGDSASSALKAGRERKAAADLSGHTQACTATRHPPRLTEWPATAGDRAGEERGSLS